MKKFFAFAFQMNQLDIVEWTTRLRAVDMLVGKEKDEKRMRPDTQFSINQT